MEISYCFRLARLPKFGLTQRIVSSEKLSTLADCLHTKQQCTPLARNLIGIHYKTCDIVGSKLLSASGYRLGVRLTGISSASRSKEEIPTVADFKEKGLNVFPDLNETIKNAMNRIPSNTEEFKNILITSMPSADQIVDNAKRSMPDMNEIKTAPLPVFMIGCAGLLPMVWPVWRFMVSGYILPGWEFFQLGYSACSISFLGGIRWGLILKEGSAEVEDEALQPTWQNLGVGLAPFAFAAIGMIMSPFFGYIMMIAGYTASAYIDLINPGLPSWYRALHAILTVGAVSMLVLALLLKIVLRRQPELKSISNNFS